MRRKCAICACRELKYLKAWPLASNDFDSSGRIQLVEELASKGGQASRAIWAKRADNLKNCLALGVQVGDEVCKACSVAMGPYALLVAARLAKVAADEAAPAAAREARAASRRLASELGAPAGASTRPRLVSTTADLRDRALGTNTNESWFSELVAYNGGRKPSVATAHKQAPMAGWWQEQRQTPVVQRGYHLPSRRVDRASYAHHALETPRKAWNFGPASFLDYKASEKACADARKLAARNVGVHHASANVSVREQQRRKACA